MRWHDQPEDELEAFYLCSPSLLHFLAMIGRSDVAEEIERRANRVRERLQSGAFSS